MNRHRSLSLALVACLLLGAAPAVWAQGSSAAHQRSNPKVLAAFRDVVAKPSLATLRVKCDGKDAALGTIISPDGWILSKASELKGKMVCKLKDGREFEAFLVNTDEKFDLALLKIEAVGLTAVEWHESKVAPVGNWVASPGIDADPVAIGVVSVAARSMPAVKAPPPANPNSGYLGVSLDPDEVGAKVGQVLPGGAAEKAGVKVNDIILSVDGKEIKDADSLIALLGGRKPGDEVKLKIKRGDEEMELKATLGKRPANSNRADFQNRLGSEPSKRRTGFPVILHHDSVIKPTDCGGPLVDLEGRVIGINIARVGRVESNAVPAEAIRPLLPRLMPEKVPAPKKAG